MKHVKRTSILAPLNRSVCYSNAWNSNRFTSRQWEQARLKVETKCYDVLSIGRNRARSTVAFRADCLWGTTFQLLYVDTRVVARLCPLKDKTLAVGQPRNVLMIDEIICDLASLSGTRREQEN